MKLHQQWCPITTWWIDQRPKKESSLGVVRPLGIPEVIEPHVGILYSSMPDRGAPADPSDLDALLDFDSGQESRAEREAREAHFFGLKKFHWVRHGSVSTAAMMLLIALSHTAHLQRSPGLKPGDTDVSYVDLRKATGLSRAKISEGLTLLVEFGIITRVRRGRNNLLSFPRYKEYGAWAKLPALQFYDARQEVITPFQDFTLRDPLEHYALKLYLLLVARRDRATNQATITQNKIRQMTGLPKSKVKAATSFLMQLGLVLYEPILRRDPRAKGVSFAYRIVGVSPHFHMGTQGRRILQEQLSSSAP